MGGVVISMRGGGGEGWGGGASEKMRVKLAHAAARQRYQHRNHNTYPTQVTQQLRLYHEKLSKVASRDPEAGLDLVLGSRLKFATFSQPTRPMWLAARPCTRLLHIVCDRTAVRSSQHRPS